MSVRHASCSAIWLAALLGACTGREPPARDSVAGAPSSQATTSALVPLDVLMRRVRESGGTFRPVPNGAPVLVDGNLPTDELRAHGPAGVQRLVECLGDDAPSGVAHAEAEGSTYPVGALCYVALEAIARPKVPAKDAAADSVHLSLESPEAATRGLPAAQRAWRRVLALRAYEIDGCPPTSVACGAGGTPAAAALSAERRVDLERAAGEIVSFLAGDGEFEALALADTVALHLAPEGAGTSAGASVRMTRAALRDREAWAIDVGGRAFSFVPPPSVTTRTVRAGTHFNCREVPLATRSPALARRPHVGVRLGPADSKSCLETWNVTFVFDTSAARPRLVAALYDQWEW